MKNHGQGFTLIEAIVVAVIIAVLAAIAIPMYNGFVRDARQDSVDNLAQTAAAAANAYWRKTGQDPTAGAHTPHTQPLNLFFDVNKYTVTVAAPSVTVAMVEHPEISSGAVDYR